MPPNDYAMDGGDVMDLRWRHVTVDPCRMFGEGRRSVVNLDLEGNQSRGRFIL